MEKTTGKIRKRYSAEQKARLVVEMLKEDFTLDEMKKYAIELHKYSYYGQLALLKKGGSNVR